MLLPGTVSKKPLQTQEQLIYCLISDKLFDLFRTCLKALLSGQNHEAEKSQCFGYRAVHHRVQL